MSKRPPKKSDLDKNWMRPRKSRELLIAPEYHLIFCEGTKTEPFYFKEIKNKINQKYPNRINLEIQGEGVSTSNLLEKAKKYVQNSANTYKHVWLVYDKDDFLAEDFDETETRCKTLTLENNGEPSYHALWSNPCIELWFLLHFCFINTEMLRAQYLENLSDYMQSCGLGLYKKNREDMYTVLSKYREQAIQNAKNLEKYHPPQTNPSQKVPMTKVYTFFEYLADYLKD